MYDENIETVLYNEMTTVNSQLISLVNKVKLADSCYFMYNNGMIDEFIGNIHEFLKQLDFNRKKASSDRLNSDVLSHIYQFLDNTTLQECCCLVSKLWRQSVDGLEVGVRGENLGKRYYWNRFIY